MEPALVSIVIPTYNRSGVICQTIDSVLAQTYTNWELLIVDDGSTDDTPRIIGQYGDPRIQYYRIEHSGIIGKVRNEGMKRTLGSLVAFLDSDDCWRNDKLMYQLSLLEQYPSASFVFSNGDEFGPRASVRPDLEELFVGSVFLPIILKKRFSLFVPSWLVKREVFDSTGWLDEAMRSGSDLDFFLTMAYTFQGIFTNERLVNIRKQEHSNSSELEVVAYDEHINTLKKFYRKSWLTRNQFNCVAGQLYYKMGRLLLTRGRGSESVRAFIDCISLNPWNYKSWILLFQAFAKYLSGYLR